ncbi:hypothetical protein [Haladaptatus sp. NG-WS-4]
MAQSKSTLEMAVTALREPHRAAYKIRELAGSPFAQLHTRFATSDLESQYRQLEVLRQHDEYLLIVLDACRYDMFVDIAPEYLTFDQVKPIRSEGRNTFEYVAQCWPDEYDDVAYISAATPVNSDSRDKYERDTLRLYDGYVPSEHLPNIRDVWRESWNESIGITPPAAVTHAALDTDSQRVVAHYFQPHAPFIGRQSLLGHADNANSSPMEGEAVDAPVWQRAKWGDLTRAQLKAVYKSNLHRVLRDVCRLVEETTIENIAIMGDHGEALGEYGIYAHPPLEHPKTRQVPWGIVSGVAEYPDSRESSSPDTSGGNVESRLSDLGYI